VNKTPETMRRLQEIIDRSAATAGPTIRKNFIGGGWAMTAEEFVAFWGETRMAAISTASASGQVHIAPLEVALVDGRFRIPAFADSQRLKDHRANARCGITAWDGPYRAVIVYGTATEEGAPGSAGGIVTVVVEPMRIYGIRPPPGIRRRDGRRVRGWEGTRRARSR
jgi:hypothetical protein